MIRTVSKTIKTVHFVFKSKYHIIYLIGILDYSENTYMGHHYYHVVCFNINFLKENKHLILAPMKKQHTSQVMLSFSNTSYTGAHVDLTIFIYLMPSLISAAVCGGTACLNGGTCIPTGGTDFNCTCEFGFIGDQCQSKLIIYVFHG